MVGSQDISRRTLLGGLGTIVAGAATGLGIQNHRLGTSLEALKAQGDSLTGTLTDRMEAEITMLRYEVQRLGGDLNSSEYADKLDAHAQYNRIVRETHDLIDSGAPLEEVRDAFAEMTRYIVPSVVTIGANGYTNVENEIYRFERALSEREARAHSGGRFGILEALSSVGIGRSDLGYEALRSMRPETSNRTDAAVVRSILQAEGGSQSGTGLFGDIFTFNSSSVLDEERASDLRGAMDGIVEAPGAAQAIAYGTLQPGIEAVYHTLLPELRAAHRRIVDVAIEYLGEYNPEVTPSLASRTQNFATETRLPRFLHRRLAEVEADRRDDVIENLAAILFTAKANMANWEAEGPNIWQPLQPYLAQG